MTLRCLRRHKINLVLLGTAVCVCGRTSLWSDFFRLIFHGGGENIRKHRKKAQLNEDKLRRKFQFVKKNISKDIIKLKNDLRSVSQLLDESQTPIIKASSEIHKTQHFIKV